MNWVPVCNWWALERWILPVQGRCWVITTPLYKRCNNYELTLPHTQPRGPEPLVSASAQSAQWSARRLGHVRSDFQPTTNWLIRKLWHHCHATFSLVQFYTSWDSKKVRFRQRICLYFIDGGNSDRQQFDVNEEKRPCLKARIFPPSQWALSLLGLLGEFKA